MMRLGLVLALLFGAAPAAMADGEQAAESHAPFELTRSLNALQDQIAFGSREALAAQPVLLRRMAEQMLGFDRSVWRDRVNARAAIEYVLSGGEPEPLRVLLAENALRDEEIELAEAALAHALGHRAEALSRFDGIDARKLPPSLGAHVALVHASLLMGDAPADAVDLLETARLLAPGTLVEEAAFRRQLSVESRLSRPESFVSLARHYFRRFPNSVYGLGFQQTLPGLWAGLDLPSDAEGFAALDRMLAGLEAGSQRCVYLAFAREHVLAGDRELTRHAAARAGALSRDNINGKARARLYLAAVEVAGADWAEAGRILHEIDPAQLPAPDAELHSAALAILSELERRPVGTDDMKSGPGPENSLGAGAREVIAAVDKLLGSLP